MFSFLFKISIVKIDTIFINNLRYLLFLNFYEFEKLKLLRTSRSYSDGHENVRMFIENLIKNIHTFF